MRPDERRAGAGAAPHADDGGRSPDAAAPFFSVVVPTFRRPEHLREAIRSVLAQTEGSFELLVVDDDPERSARSVTEGFADERIRYLANERARGASGARNTGGFRARGPWIAFLDDDDLWEPDKLAAQRRAAERSGDGVGLIYTGHVKFDDATGEEISRFTPEVEGELTRELLYRNRLGGFFSIAVRRDVFEEVGGLDEAFPAMQDMEFYVRVSKVTRIGYVAQPLVRVRVGDQGRISDDYPRKLAASLLFLERFDPDLRSDPRLLLRARRSAFVYAVGARDVRRSLEMLPSVALSLAVDPPGAFRSLRSLAWLLRRQLGERSQRKGAPVETR